MNIINKNKLKNKKEIKLNEFINIFLKEKNVSLEKTFLKLSNGYEHPLGFENRDEFIYKTTDLIKNLIKFQSELQNGKTFKEIFLTILTLIYGVGSGKTEASKYFFTILKKIYKSNDKYKIFSIFINLNGNLSSIVSNFHHDNHNISGFLFLFGVFGNDFYNYYDDFLKIDNIYISEYEFKYENVINHFYELLKKKYGKENYFLINTIWDEYSRFYEIQNESEIELEYNWWKEFIYIQYNYIFNNLKDLKLFLISIINGTVPIDFVASKYSSVHLGIYLKNFNLKVIKKIIREKIFKPNFGDLKNFDFICKKIFEDNEFNIFFFENGFIPRMILFLKISFEEVIKNKKNLKEYLLSDFNKNNEEISFFNDLFNQNLLFQNTMYGLNENNKSKGKEIMLEIKDELMNILLSNTSYEKKNFNDDLFEKILKLQKLGEIYFDENNKIFIKPNQFRKLFSDYINTKYKYLLNKNEIFTLPTKKKEFGGIKVEILDLINCMERIKKLKKSKKEDYVSFDELFPGKKFFNNN
jgi:hypothetical protein